jgi:hypothetical protein
MITTTDQERLLTTLQRDWDSEVRSEGFRAICAGKERGHRIADHAEERTVGFIEQEGFPVAFEHGQDKLPRARSMGDIWLRSGVPPIYNPINVKAGIAGVSGQPNMVSLEKLTKALLAHLIDSYWLLLIRVTVGDGQYSAHITLVNIFDYLDFMHFDSGPGQLMLRSDAFYEHFADHGAKPNQLTPGETVQRLVDMRRDGNERLIANRRKSQTLLEERVATFDPTSAVDQRDAKLFPPQPHLLEP